MDTCANWEYSYGGDVGILGLIDNLEVFTYSL